MDIAEIETPHGLARAHRGPVASPRATLVLGHGAGGSVAAPDLQVAAQAATELGFEVVLVEQPYRVAGRRSPAPARQLDAAWTSVIEQLAPVRPLVVGGRSSGARVACRTADATGAAAVLCLAFPLEAARRSGQSTSRLPELDAVTVPTLVVQGTRDRFGVPPAGAARAVVQVSGDHALRGSAVAIRAAVTGWLEAVALRAAR